MRLQMEFLQTWVFFILHGNEYFFHSFFKKYDTLSVYSFLFFLFDFLPPIIDYKCTKDKEQDLMILTGLRVPSSGACTGQALRQY